MKSEGDKKIPLQTTRHSGVKDILNSNARLSHLWGIWGGSLKDNKVRKVCKDEKFRKTGAALYLNSLINCTRLFICSLR